MWPFSYSRCAVDIVYLAEKPSLREASCWRVVVRNGAYGERRYGFRSTDLDVVGAPVRPAARGGAGRRGAVPGGRRRPREVQQAGIAKFPAGGEIAALRHPAAVDRGQPAGERGDVVAGLLDRGEDRFEVPVRGGAERDPLPLPGHDQPGGHRLNP